MTRLTAKILKANPAAPDPKQIEEQLRLIDEALKQKISEPRRAFLHASYQALQWARCPNAFATPVQISTDI